MSWLVGDARLAPRWPWLVGWRWKSVAIGALMPPLQDGISQLSSVLIFAGLALGQLAGAAALSARQHRPGARAYGAARDQYRWPVRVRRVRPRSASGRRQSNRCCRACARRASGVESGTCPACARFGLGAGRSSQPEW